MSHPNLQNLVDGAILILAEIARHPDFLSLNYHPDVTIGDAQDALTYIKSELENNQQISLESESSL